MASISLFSVRQREFIRIIKIVASFSLGKIDTKMSGSSGNKCKRLASIFSLIVSPLLRHTLDLDRERLFALLSHKILVKIWDGKEYCSVRTRLDKPRISRALSSTLSKTGRTVVCFFSHSAIISSVADEANSPKNVIQRLAENYADKWLPKPLLYKLHRKLPIELPSPSAALQKKSSITLVFHFDSTRRSSSS